MKTFAVILLSLLLASGCSKGNSLNLPETGPLNTDMNEVKELTSQGFITMAQNLEREGDFTTAAQFYSEAINDDPNLLEAHLGMARVAIALGNVDQAVLHYGHVLVLDPNNLTALRYSTPNLIGSDRLADALKILDRYLGSNPPTPELLSYLGVIHDLGANHTVAQAAYRQGLQMVSSGDSWHVILLNNQALSLALSNKFSQAVFLLNPYIGDMRLGMEGMTRDQSSFRQNLALVYALSGKPESAFDVAKSTLPADQAEFNRAFYEAIPSLNSSQKARAVFLGVLPESSGP
ncbi:MAG: tetratricopeptide repeat protein [Sphingomonadales bacterium]